VVSALCGPDDALVGLRFLASGPCLGKACEEGEEDEDVVDFEDLEVSLLGEQTRSMSETMLLGDRRSFLAIARSPLSESDSDSYYSSEVELADASAQTEATLAQSADTQTCTEVSDGATQAGAPWSELTDFGAQTERTTTVSTVAQTWVPVAHSEAQVDVVVSAAAEVQTFVAVSESEAQSDRTDVAAAEVQTFVALSESEAQADMIEAESAAAEMSVQTLTDLRSSSDMHEWESWWDKALSLPPPPDCSPFDVLAEGVESYKGDKENQWKLPPIHATSPTKSDAPAWLRATLISEWDVSPKDRPKGVFSEWAIAAAARTRPRRRNSMHNPVV
jgi:hypothetical protein